MSLMKTLQMFVCSALTALMVACGPSTAPTVDTGNTGGGTVITPAGNALSLDRIQGILSAAESHGGTLTLYNGYTKDGHGFLTELVSAQVGVDGSVNLPLTNVPPSQEFDSFLGGSCTFKGKTEGGTGKVAFYLQSELDASQGDPVGDVSETVAGSGGKVLVLRVYADSPQTYRGIYTCSSGSVTTFDVALRKGWNALTYSATSATAASVLSAPVDIRTELTLEKYTPKVAIFFGTPALNLKAGESVTTNATFYQIGAISGKIDLSTDVAGVSVEPASVTLTPLGTQGVNARDLFGSVAQTPKALHVLSVGAQKLTASLTFRAGSDANGFNGSMNVLASQGGKAVGKQSVPLSLVTPKVLIQTTGSQDVTVERGRTADISFNVTATGFYKGDAQVSLTDLPAGITASTISLTFTGTKDSESQAVVLKVSASGSATLGLTPVRAVVTAAGKVSQADVRLSVPAPAVSAAFDQSDYGFVYAGQQKTVSLTLQSLHGYAGAINLNLGGLPAGVSAGPVAVQMRPYEQSKATFVIQSAGNAQGVRATLTVFATDLTAPVVRSTLEVRPAYLASVGADPLRVFAASEGVWLVNDSQSNGSPGQYRIAVRRQVGTKVVLTTTVFIDDIFSTVFNSPNGDLIILGNKQVVRLKDDGSVSTFTPLPDTQFSVSSGPAVVDQLNQLWFYTFRNGYQLIKVNLDSGAVENVRSESGNNGTIRLHRNLSGDIVYAVGLDGSQVRWFRASTGENRLLNLPVNTAAVTAYAVSQDGSLLIKTASSLLTLTLAGSTTSSQNTLNIDKMVFDGNQALWMSRKGNETVWKTDLQTQQTLALPVGSSGVNDAARGTGLWLISQESVGSNNVYLSLIP